MNESLNQIKKQLIGKQIDEEELLKIIYQYISEDYIQDVRYSFSMNQLTIKIEKYNFITLNVVLTGEIKDKKIIWTYKF